MMSALLGAAACVMGSSSQGSGVGATRRGVLPARSQCLDRSVDPQALLASLDEEQRHAATVFGVPLAVHAPAGSGKTRTVAARLAYGIAIGALEPQQCLALTFTTRAAGELRARLAALGSPLVATRTIHAAALRQLRFFWARSGGAALPQLQADRDALIAQARERLSLPTDTESVIQTATHIAWAKSHMYDPDTFAAMFEAAMRVPPRGGDARELARVYAEYELIKATSGVMDFDDVLTLLIGLLDEQPEAASQVRRTYRHLTVDEFQDTSPLQFALIRQWAGPRRDICVVGDPDQAIYGFAGADARYLRDFADYFPGADVVSLQRTYRCAPTIVAVARSLGLGEGTQPTGVGNDGDYREIECVDDVHELTMVCERVAQLRAEGVDASRIAVLARQQDQVNDVVEALRADGQPVAMRGMVGFFQRPEVKLALLDLRASGEQSVLEAVTKLVTDAGWMPEQSETDSLTHWDSYAVLLRLAQTLHEQDPSSKTEDFLAEVYQRAEALELPAAPAVSVMTMHAAKGLEWDAVIVVGMVEGVMPHAHARSESALAEERRLLYVAMTRARQSLTLTWPKTRKGQPATRSRFLNYAAASVSVNPGT